MSTEDTLIELRDGIFDGEPLNAGKALDQLITSKEEPENILKKSIIPAIRNMGQSMADGDFFMPEVKISTKVLKEITSKLKTYSQERLNMDSIDPPPWTGEGDIDDIGGYLGKTLENADMLPAPELLGLLECIATGLDSHEFTPCKIQGSEVQQR